MKTTADETEEFRKSRMAEFKRTVESHDTDAERERLETQYGRVWNTAELSAGFEIMGFAAPYVVVQRKADGLKGSLEFQHTVAAEQFTPAR